MVVFDVCKIIPVALLLNLGLSIAKPQQDHPQTVNIGQRNMKFVDDARGRELMTEVWYPTTDSIKQSDNVLSGFKRSFTVNGGALPKEKKPLILISHGSGGNRLSLEWLAQSLAGKGYMVAAVDHWGNTYDHKIALEFIKPWERPLDISYVLTQLLEDDALGKVIDPDRIGALGFSFGGYTVIALAGAVLDYPTLLDYYDTAAGKQDLANILEFPGLHQTLKDSSFIRMTTNIPPLKDRRIRAFFAISPGTAQGFTNNGQFKDVTAPVFIVGCESDKVTPVVKYARYYHSLISHSEYYEFKGKAGHYVMLAEANDEIKKEAPEVFTDAPSVDRKKVHQKVAGLAALFFDKHLVSQL